MTQIEDWEDLAVVENNINKIELYNIVKNCVMNRIDQICLNKTKYEFKQLLKNSYNSKNYDRETFN